jgi:hypothetical protein
MLKDQCISITDLRTKTKTCLEDLEREPKYIFINNKPIAVIVDIVEYEKNFTKPELTELPVNEVDEQLKKEAKSAKSTRKLDLLDI